MNCTLKLEDGTIISGPDILTIMRKALIQSSLKSDSFRDTFLQDLNFFNSDAENIEHAINILDKAEANGTIPVFGDFAITRIASNYFYQKKEFESESLEILHTFYKVWGDLFSEAMDMANRQGELGLNNTIDKILSMLLDYKTKLLKDTSDYKNSLLYKSSTESGKKIWDMVVELANNPDLIKKSVYNCATKFFGSFIDNSDFGLFGPNRRTELSLWEPIRGNIIGGRMDAITWDEKGNVIIWDFKTAVDPKVTKAALLQHYFLLLMYKKILSHRFNIPESKILIKNILIAYNSELGFYIDENLSIYDTDIKINEYGTDIRFAADLKIKEFYPRTSKKVSSSDRDDLLSEVEIASGNIISDFELKRNLKEAIKERIENAFKNRIDLWLTLSPVPIKRITKQGDIYQLFDNDDKQIISGPLDSIVELELQNIKERRIDTVKLFINALITHNNGFFDSFLANNLKGNLSIKLMFQPYLSIEWEYIENEDLELFGIISMYNDVTKQTDFIILNPDVADLKVISNPSKNILLDVFKDLSALKEFKEFDALPEPSLKNIYKLLSLIAISKYRETLPDDLNIGAIKIVSTINGTHDTGLDTNKFMTILLLLEHYAKENPDAIENPEVYKNIYSQLKDVPIKSEIEIVLNEIINVLRQAGKFYGELTSLQSIDLDNLTIEKLKKILAEIIALHPEIKTGKFTSDLGILYGEISRFLEMLRAKLPQDVYEINSKQIDILYAISAGIDLLTRGDSLKYAKSGMKLTGFAQGLDLSTAYSNPSDIVKRFDMFMRTYSLQISEQTQKNMLEVNTAVKDWLNSLHIPLDRLWARHQKYYERLLQKNEDGSINRQMLFINPYLSKNENLFASSEEKYALEVMLWALNRIRMKGLTTNIASLSYSELIQNETAFQLYKDAISNDEYNLRVPLRPEKKSNSNWRLISNFIKSRFNDGEKMEWNDLWQGLTEHWSSYLEPINLTAQQKDSRDKAIKQGIYFNYFNENERNRSERCEQTEPSDWFLNLNQLVCEYITENSKEFYFTKLLDLVDNQVGVLKLMEVVTGENMDAQIDTLKGRVEISIYNKAQIEDEDSNNMRFFGALKRVMAKTKIAIRPALYVKEILLGRIRNTSAILTNLIHNDNKITLKHLAKAEAMVFGSDLTENMFTSENPGDVSLIDAINNTYLINDRDLHVLPTELAYDRFGLNGHGDRVQYTNTIHPDWVNRMSIFVAKMIADGTLDAHSLKDGILIYNIEKDERYNYFWKYKNDPKAAPDLKKFMYLRALYKLKMDEFRSEGFTRSDGTMLKSGEDNEYDALPRAYTNAENDSIKEQIGLIYSYYTHEEKARYQYTMWWLVYTVFATFLPGEILRNLRSGHDNTSISSVVHVELPFADPKTGCKKLFFKYDNKLGTVIKVTTLNDSGIDENGNLLEPVLETVCHPREGLLRSTIKTIGRIVRFDWKGLKGDPLAIYNALLFTWNNLFMFLIYKLLKWIFGDSDSKGAIMAIDTAKRVSGELSLYQSLVKQGLDIGGVPSLYLLLVLGSVFKTINPNNNYSLLNLANDNFAIVKDVHIVN